MKTARILSIEKITQKCALQGVALPECPDRQVSTLSNASLLRRHAGHGRGGRAGTQVAMTPGN
jgi:hypothetical protein